MLLAVCDAEPPGEEAVTPFVWGAAEDIVAVVEDENNCRMDVGSLLSRSRSRLRVKGCDVIAKLDKTSVGIDQADWRRLWH